MLNGLSPEEVAVSRQQHGSNVLTPPKRASFWKLYIDKYRDPIIQILLFAILITLQFGLSNNSIQANTICGAMQEAFGWSPIWVGVALATMALFIVFGGIQRIAKVSSVIVPLMAVSYIILALVIIIMNIGEPFTLRVRATGDEVLVPAESSCLIPAAIADYDLIPVHGSSKVMEAFINNKKSIGKTVKDFFHLFSI